MDSKRVAEGFAEPLRTAMARVSFPISDDTVEKIRDFSFHHQRARELRG
jgi:hypothetical protein